MRSFISLHQISTQLDSKRVRHSFVPSRVNLDCTEYCLGLERGGIETVDSKLLAIPESDYEYQFLCLSPPSGCQWRVDGEEYPFPLRDFPPVRTRIHPCFLFPSLMDFIVRGPDDESHLETMRDLVDICDHINFTHIRSVYRITPFARPDRPEHLPRPSQSAPSSQESAARRPASSKRVKIKSPPKTTSKRTGTSTKKALLKAPSSSKAVSRKPPARKRKFSQSSATSAEEEVPLKRHSPRFAPT
ncbi:hypothetical protein BDZ89DRAFT_1087326 [Hymenopellis radicata]|nr:hypothetical protein BDZ89DRAFT_1087326 [Hymenopellis radicata]